MVLPGLVRLDLWVGGGLDGEGVEGVGVVSSVKWESIYLGLRGCVHFRGCFYLGDLK